MLIISRCFKKSNMGNLIFWVVIIGIIIYIYLRKKGKIPPIIKFSAVTDYGKKTPVIEEDRIVQEWSAYIDGGHGRGERVLQEIERGIKEAKIPDISLNRKQAYFGRKESFEDRNKRDVLSVVIPQYRDFEILISAIDRAGQLKVSWFILDIQGNLVKRIAALNAATDASLPFSKFTRSQSRSSKKAGRWLARKINERLTGSPGVTKVRAHEMTLDDKENFGAYVSGVHHAVLTTVQQVMTELDQDFSKVDTKSQGFLNIS